MSPCNTYTDIHIHRYMYMYTCTHMHINTCTVCTVCRVCTYTHMQRTTMFLVLHVCGTMYCPYMEGVLPPTCACRAVSYSWYLYVHTYGWYTPMERMIGTGWTHYLQMEHIICTCIFVTDSGKPLHLPWYMWDAGIGHGSLLCPGLVP